MVSRRLAYGSAWDGTRIAFLSSGVRGGGPRAGRVHRPRERIALDRYRIARRCRDRRRCRPRGGRRWLLSDRGGGGGRGRCDPRGVRLALPNRTACLRMAELDRLQEGRGDRQAATSRGREPELARPHERRGIECRVAARFRDFSRLAEQPPRGIDDQAQDDVSLDLLIVQPRRVLDRRVAVERDGGFLIGWRPRAIRRSGLVAASPLAA